MAWFPKLMGFLSLTHPATKSPGDSRGISKAAVVHRDELTVKKHGGKSRPAWSEEGQHEKDNDGEKGVQMRVKLKLTKEEARRLLLKCKEGGVLEFRDVARELARIRENRIVSVDVIS